MKEAGLRVLATLAAASMVGIACGAGAAAPVLGPGSYGQQLIGQRRAQHPRIASLTLYITLPGAAAAQAIAASDGQVGAPPPAAAEQALRAWRAHFTYDAAARELEADVPLLDMSHKKAGVMTIALRGGSRRALEREAIVIRNQLDSYAQHLVDEELAKHRDVMILAIHATTPKNADPEILASNIGRIGKKADDDDMRVVRDGKTNLEVNRDLGRYEVELPLKNAAGERIGALGVVFPLTAHTDQKARHLEAIRIRDEIARQIPSAAKLVEPST
jgi:hypothetical protein